MGEKISRYREMTIRYGDPWIWGIYLTLVVLSVVESYSASSRDVALYGVYNPIIKQVIYLLIGAFFVIGLSRINYNNKVLLLVLIPLLWVFTMVSLIYVMVAGEVVNGAQRAFTIPVIGLSVQPSELAKLSAVTALAYIMARNQQDRDVSNKGVAISAAVVAFFGALMINSGLTNTLLLMSISGAMFVVGGAKIKKLLVVFGIYIIVAGVFWGWKEASDKREENIRKITAIQENTVDKSKTVDRHGMRKGRIYNWLHRDELIHDSVNSENSQEMFSIMAQAHGGLTGVGIGNSRECSRLPLAFSDYIYSIIIEEIGFIGGIFVIILYLWLLSRAAMIARRCHRVLPALLIIGMAAMITFQALFHMAINTGVFPVSGEPLPLISKGGTSILVTSVAIGVMLSVSRTISNKSNGKNKDDGNSLPSGLDARNPSEIPVKNEWKL
ncbi:MAG: FtsW/RodA/SpoVE family cell cycle protein [Muribaculaceae bacterium]|nr:FtsW/RodA/SpoVE family cell cycle protein [Muribaculaceae bacterium]MBR6489944.1 FtsW/RodA/SpoVE family cell cycle protein [Muribaculaceae bacterium]